MQAFDPTTDNLRRLASSRGYELVERENSFWLINGKTTLPEVNETQGGLVFSFEDVRQFLEGLSPISSS